MARKQVRECSREAGAVHGGQAPDPATGSSPGEPILNSESVIRRVAGSSTVQGADGRRRALIIAVVGLSPDPERPSHRVAGELKRLGYRIVPVNPKHSEILGERAYSSLDEVPFPVDVVQVFRAPEHALDIAHAAAKRPEKPVLWLQEGIINEKAVEIAAAGGLPVVMDRCLWKEIQRLQGTIASHGAAQPVGEEE